MKDGSCSRSLGENFGDGLAGFAPHFEGSLAGGEYDLIVLEPHGGGDGGIEVGGPSLFGDDVRSRFVGRSMNGSTFDASSSEDEGEGFREVISPSVRIDFRSTAKFGSDDDEGAFEKPALFEIGEEGCVSLVEDRKLFVGLREVVGVPVEAAKLDLDKADAVLDETSGEEDTFAKLIIAICRMCVFAFLGEIEGFEVLRFHEADGGAEHFVVSTDATLAVLEACAEVGIELGAQGDLTVEGSFGNVVTSFGVLKSFFGITNRKRSGIGFEEPGSRVIVSGVDGDEGRKGSFEAAGVQFIGPGAERRVGDRSPLSVRSVDVVVALGVCSLSGGHGANDGHFVGVFGGALEVLAELNAIDFGRNRFDGATILGGSVWFRVKGVDMRHTSSHVEVDDVFGFAV